MLSEYLSEAGFAPMAVGDARGLRDVMAKNRFDLVILDLILPDADGISLVREIREGGNVPIVMLTSKSDEVERIIGLEIGADDYVAKPFSPRELLARIKSIFRRIEAATERAKLTDDYRVKVRFADWELDLTSRCLKRPDGTEVRLTNSEFQLLATFVERPQRVLTRNQLLEFSRTDPEAVFDRTIDYLILKLRRKIEDDPRAPKLIRTEHGAGYVFAPKVTRL